MKYNSCKLNYKRKFKKVDVLFIPKKYCSINNFKKYLTIQSKSSTIKTVSNNKNLPFDSLRSLMACKLN